MAVSPLLTNDAEEEPGELDDDPGMDEMMTFDQDQERIMRQEWRVEDFGDEEPRPPQRPRYQTRSQSGDRAAPPGPQVRERSLAAGSGQVAVREESEEEKEQRGFLWF